MDKKLRQMQYEILDIFSRHAKTFALAGGTALELYYLHHRFSADLDFFSPKYKVSEVESVISEFKKSTGIRIKMQSEFIAQNRAKVRFYAIPIKGHERMLKIDFVEDVLFDHPDIKKIKSIPVYSVENIYLQKITAITGSSLTEDDIGRDVAQGRREARDIFDVYMLSKKIKALHLFLRELPEQFQRGMIHWYQTFSRQDLKLELLDLDIYDKEFDSRQMIVYLEGEINRFMRQVLR